MILGISFKQKFIQSTGPTKSMQNNFEKYTRKLFGKNVSFFENHKKKIGVLLHSNNRFIHHNIY